MHEKD